MVSYDFQYVFLSALDCCVLILVIFISIGLGLQKGKFLHYSKSDAMIQLMQTIKTTVDPNGIMNPYKYLPEN
jgi:FAD/FMN-containing dehydrogenase